VLVSRSRYLLLSMKCNEIVSKMRDEQGSLCTGILLYVLELIDDRLLCFNLYSLASMNIYKHP
jgi:hypothetical protein